jgi:hypothetical protein
MKCHGFSVCHSRVRCFHLSPYIQYNKKKKRRKVINNNNNNSLHCCGEIKLFVGNLSVNCIIVFWGVGGRGDDEVDRRQ